MKEFFENLLGTIAGTATSNWNKILTFVLVLVLPMLAFIGYQIYKLVVIYMAAKKEEILEEAKAGVSDEAKDAIIKEYLAKMQAEKNSADEQNSSKDESGQD